MRTLTRWSSDDTERLFRAEVVIGELLANSLQHALPQEISLTLVEGDDALMVEVEDGGGPSRPSQPGRACDDAESGRGLALIATLSHTWSWRPAANGRRITWAYLPDTR
ncbi:ATP-binding protein [Streptomyces sp. AV19]|nr:ATP-binding protein [Streptomyces sp. AV19]